MKTAPTMTSQMKVEDFPGAQIQADGSVIIDMAELIEFHLDAIDKDWSDVAHVDFDDDGTLITVTFNDPKEENLIITLAPPKSQFN